MLARPAGGSVARIGCLVPEEAVLVAPLSGGVSLQAGLITQRPWLLIGLLGVVLAEFFCLTHRGHVSVPIWRHIWLRGDPIAFEQLVVAQSDRRVPRKRLPGRHSLFGAYCRGQCDSCGSHSAQLPALSWNKY